MLDKAGILVAVVNVIVDKFYEKRYLLVLLAKYLQPLLPPQ